MKPPVKVTERAHKRAPEYARPGAWVVVFVEGEAVPASYRASRDAIRVAQRRHLLTNRHAMVIGPGGTSVRVSMGIAISDARQLIRERALELHIQGDLFEGPEGSTRAGEAVA